LTDRIEKEEPVDEIVTHIIDQPLGNLSFLAGIAFLAIAVVGNISGKIQPGKVGRLASGALGVGLLFFGVSAHSHDIPNSTRKISPPPSRINVVAGSYGQNCGALYGNATVHLASKCNDRETCDYTIDYKVIGDPAIGCKKDYLAEWKCGEATTIHSASASGESGLGTKIVLSCQ
jgi:hypothetical protein